MLLITIAFLGFLVVLFLGVLGLQVLGQHVGARRLARGLAPSGEGDGTIEGSLFALLGLLMAFSISGGEARLNVRRDLIVQEANAIGTAYARLDLLPEEAQPMLREEFRRYMDVRLAYFESLLRFRDIGMERRRVHGLQEQIWKDAVTAAGDAADERATLLVLPAINAMIDVTTAREAALRTHVPLAVFGLLVLLTFVSSFFAGLGRAKQGRPSHIHTVAFALTLAVTAYVILNLEFPRAGFIRLDILDSLLAQVRADMG